MCGGLYMLIHTLVSTKACGRFVFVLSGLCMPFWIKIPDTTLLKSKNFKKGSNDTESME